MKRLRKITTLIKKSILIIFYINLKKHRLSIIINIMIIIINLSIITFKMIIIII